MEDFQFSSPFSYVKHINFLDTTEFNQTMPTYINIVRHPVDRIISWYYYTRAPWYLVNDKKRTATNGTGVDGVGSVDGVELSAEDERRKLKERMPSMKMLKTSLADCVTNEISECVYRKGNLFKLCNHF